jgi:hypothetical protein
MLSGTHPYGADLGTITGLSWQTRGDGWKVDDLAVRFLRSASGTLGLSLKNDRQVTSSGFPEHFIRAAWEQYADTQPSNPFQRERDLIGIGVGEIAETVLEAWHTLLGDLRVGDPERIAARYSKPGESPALGRRLLQSFVSVEHPTLVGAASLARHLRLFHFNFRDTGSLAQAGALWACQIALQSGTATEARNLWTRLLALAAEHRRAGGSLDQSSLVAELRKEFQLKDRPDHASAWVRLDRRSRERVDDLTDSIANRLSLLRSDVMNDLLSLVATGQCILLVGEGGAGKSALAKRLATHPVSFQRYLWLDAASLDHESLDEIEKDVGLSVRLPELLAECAASSSCLVLDGLETFSTRAIARATALVKTLTPNPAVRGWTVVATTRPQAIEQAHFVFRQLRVSESMLSTFYVEHATPQDCAAVLASCPNWSCPDFVDTLVKLPLVVPCTAVRRLAG